MGQRALVIVGTVVGIGALLLVTMPRSASPEPQAVAGIPTLSTPVAPTASTAPTQPAATTGRTAFISTVHQYAFMLPPDWTPRASTDATVPDRFDGREGEALAVRFVRLPEGGATDPWISEQVPVRAIASGYCVRNSSFDTDRHQFDDSYVGDIDARMRLGCGFVDAVATAGDRAWILSLEDPSSTTGDMVSFRSLTDTFRSLPDPDATPRPTPTPTPAPTVPPDWVEFSSDVLGYSLQYPGHWEPRPLDGPEDYFESDGGTQLWVERLAVAAQTSVVAWADKFIPDRAVPSASHRICVFRSVGASMPAFPATFRATEIQGRPVAIRALCGYVDAVIDLGDQTFLVLTHRSPEPSNTADDHFVERIIAGLRLAEDRR